MKTLAGVIVAKDFILSADCTLSMKARFVLLAVSDRMYGTRESFCSYDDIARRTGLSVPSVGRALGELCEAGVLRRGFEAGRGRKVYTFILALNGVECGQRDRMMDSESCQADGIERANPINLRGGIRSTCEVESCQADTQIRPSESCSPESGKNPDRASTAQYPPGFLRVWALYPHFMGRRAKSKSAAVWIKRRLEGRVEQVVRWLEIERESPGWLKEGGQYVPGLEVWLRRVDFDDDPPAPAPVARQTTTAGGDRILTRSEWEQRPSVTNSPAVDPDAKRLAARANALRLERGLDTFVALEQARRELEADGIGAEARG